MEDKDRVALIMAKFNLTSNNFAAKANLSPATLSHILTGRSKPTLTILRNIVAGFPAVPGLVKYAYRHPGHRAVLQTHADIRLHALPLLDRLEDAALVARLKPPVYVVHAEV